MSNYFDFLCRSWPLLVQGAAMTLTIAAGAASLSLMMGAILGVLSSNRIVVFSAWVEAVTFVIRAVPFYVQLLMIYFVLPDLVGWSLEPLTASIVSLGICSSGYVAQNLRGGINAIPVEQWEAARVLGYTTLQTVWYVILPQVVRHVLPSINNELEALLKSTAVVSSIGMLELTRVGMNLVSREMEPVPTYLTVALVYVVMSAIIDCVTRRLERRIVR